MDAAGLTSVYHDYYAGPSLIETRNGSDLVVQQYVWRGLLGGYVDELIQIASNDDLLDGGEQVCETKHWALSDASYCIIGLVDASGDLVERYEYTPYGERQVYVSAGSNDALAQTPRMLSRRVVTDGSIEQPWGLNPFGFQGLLHEDATGLVHNRARSYHVRFGRFIQADPAGYPDGYSRYAAYHVMRGSVDPTGLDDTLTMRFDRAFEHETDQRVARSQMETLIDVVSRDGVVDAADMGTLRRHYGYLISLEVDRVQRNLAYSEELRGMYSGVGVLRGTLSITTSTVTIGGSDALGLTDSDRYQGGGYGTIRGTAEVATIAVPGWVGPKTARRIERAWAASRGRQVDECVQAASSQRQPWLQYWEGLGRVNRAGYPSLGHTIGRHVGRTDQELLDRLLLNPKINAASTFTDQTVAEEVIGSTIAANRTEIAA